MLVQPKFYEKLAVGTRVEIWWIGPGKKTIDSGELLYAYTRPHAIADETGKVIGMELRPQRAGIRPHGRNEVTLHYTNGFEVHRI